MDNPDFLKKKYDLHNSEEVKKAAKHTERLTGEKVPENPSEQIQNYLDRFSEIINDKDEYKRERGMYALKKVLHDKFVIKPQEIPESYFENQKRIAREQGHGDIEITKEAREQLTEVVIADQRSTLDNWIDYLSSSDATYPDWLKYYAFRNVVGMGEYDKEKKAFAKRSKGTTKPFPDINREVFAYVLDAISKKYGKSHLNLLALDQEEKKEFKKLLQGENFPKLYAWALEKLTIAPTESLEKIAGKWVKYSQNSDNMPLVESLRGHGTGWCTAGELTAKTQLQGGDFYVYYSLDQKGKATVPRAAIRMQGNQIGEVRGIAAEQNLDPYVASVVQEKLKEFPDGAKYEKKTQDMKFLTAIENKVKNNQELNKDDLRFLYQIDSKIEGFGYRKDPRIWEIITGRNKIINGRNKEKQDLANIFDCKPEQVAFMEEEATSGDILYYYGDLILSNITSAEGLKFPENIWGDLYLDALTSTEGLELPKSIRGDFYMRYITSAKGLKFPESIGGSIILSSLTSAEDIKFPENIKGDLALNRLTSAKGVKLPESIGGVLDLKDLTSSEGIEFPRNVGGYQINLGSLTSAKGLKLPEVVEGSLDLNSLTSTEGLKLPERIGNQLSLNSLISAKGLKLPKGVRELHLNSLTSTEGLKLPEIMERGLELKSLTSAKGLKLPKSIGAGLDLRSLTSAEGLEFPESIGDYLYLDSLTSAEGLELPKRIGRGLGLERLASIKGLKLPESVGGRIDLDRLTLTDKDKLREEYPKLNIK